MYLESESRYMQLSFNEKPLHRFNYFAITVPVIEPSGDLRPGVHKSRLDSELCDQRGAFCTRLGATLHSKCARDGFENMHAS
jgi:hypothetical protein